MVVLVRGLESGVEDPMDWSHPVKSVKVDLRGKKRQHSNTTDRWAGLEDLEGKCDRTTRG
jgi:hypothetical protein